MANVPVEILGLHHYTLRTRDLKRATAFYEGVFGLKRKPQPGAVSRTARYDIGGQELQLLEVDDLPEGADAPDPRESHPAIEVDNIHTAVAACLTGGAEMQQVIFARDEDGSQSAFLRDPDGNLLELCSHNGRFSRRAPIAAMPLALGAVPPALASPSLVEVTAPVAEDYKAENFFSNRNEKRENGRLIVGLVIATVILGAGVALRYTIFAPRFVDTNRLTASPALTAKPSDGATTTPSPKSAVTATPYIPTPLPTPTPETESITPSLSESGGLPAPPAKNP